MVTPLYGRFLEEQAEYDAAERFWEELFREVVGSADALEWHRWRPRAYANGTPLERDGNPMFDTLNSRLRRALQVIQWPAESSAIEISAWISEMVVERADQLLPVEELTINLSLSRESASIARSLISEWVNEAVPVDVVRERIRAMSGDQ